MKTSILVAQNGLFITTNKNAYVAGEQVRFDLTLLDKGLQPIEDEYLAIIDLVAPDGRIIQTKGAINSPLSKYFFLLPDTLSTGIYRLITSSKGIPQSVKRVHVYGTSPEKSKKASVYDIDYIVQGGVLVKEKPNKVFIRVTDKSGAGVSSKGTLTNSADSLIQYLDSDDNGILSMQVTPSDSIYRIRFDNQVTELRPLHVNFSVSLVQKENEIVLIPKRYNATDSVKSILIDKQILSNTQYSTDSLGTVRIKNEQLSPGIHFLESKSVEGFTQKFLITIKTKPPENLLIPKMNIGRNEFHEFYIEDKLDEISLLSISVIDEKDLLSENLDFYEEYYFGQGELDLQLVANRDIQAYIELFYHKLHRSSSEERLSYGISTILDYKQQSPFDHISLLNLRTLTAIDELNGDLRGIHNFEEQMDSKATVFPYHFTSYLEPIELAGFDKISDYRYPSLKTKLFIGEEEKKLIKLYDLQRNIILSYNEQEQSKPALPEPDYTYVLENYDIPNTTTELINYIVKYVSVGGGKETPQISMFRSMSSYKYSGKPLLFINNLPVYDARTILNMSPKDFIKIEVRNSNVTNEQFGYFGLNGSISFYLEKEVINPLANSYTNLPVLEPYQEFNQSLVKNEFAPDFRHQLFWSSQVEKKNTDTFWIDLKASDLSTSYHIHLRAFMKDGSVVQSQSMLSVQ